jgi:two-component system sensor histidine kinase KdpD
MARLQSGTVKLNRQWQPLEEVLGSAIKSVSSILGIRQIVVRLPDNLPLLEFDAALIERVISNLLENASKYTPSNSSIGICAAIGVADQVDIWVEDNCPGLPAGKEEDLFKKFERGQKESATPGVGLGLAICRAIAEAHGGNIRAENRPKGGARFTLSLPCGTPSSIDHAADERLAAEENL